MNQLGKQYFCYVAELAWKYKLFPIVILICTYCNIISAQDFIAPDLEFVMELKVTISTPVDLGETPRGKRVIIPITGGEFEGPDLSGSVLKGGADYQYVAMEGQRTELEAIYTIKTNDGILIHVRNEGILFVPQDNIPAEDASVYFRTAPKFEAPLDSKYAWLNNTIFIGKPVPKKDHISIQIWKVL